MIMRWRVRARLWRQLARDGLLDLQEIRIVVRQSATANVELLLGADTVAHFHSAKVPRRPRRPLPPKVRVGGVTYSARFFHDVPGGRWIGHPPEESS